MERCGEPIGKQDQYAAAFGGFNLIRFHPDDTVEVEKVLCSPQLIAQLQDRLLFFYTGVTRSASVLLQQQSTEMAVDKEKSNAMAEMVRLARSAYANLCDGRIDALGAMLHDAWQIKKQMANGITNSLIDESYQAALDAGAEGGKLLGAGGGGFLMFLAPPERHEAIRVALCKLREIPFRFAVQGSSIIFVQ